MFDESTTSDKAFGVCVFCNELKMISNTCKKCRLGCCEECRRDFDFYGEIVVVCKSCNTHLAEKSLSNAFRDAIREQMNVRSFVYLWLFNMMEN